MAAPAWRPERRRSREPLQGAPPIAAPIGRCWQQYASTLALDALLPADEIANHDDGADQQHEYVGLHGTPAVVGSPMNLAIDPAAACPELRPLVRCCGDLFPVPSSRSPDGTR